MERVPMTITLTLPIVNGPPVRSHVVPCFLLDMYDISLGSRGDCVDLWRLFLGGLLLVAGVESMY